MSQKNKDKLPQACTSEVLEDPDHDDKQLSALLPHNNLSLLNANPVPHMEAIQTDLSSTPLLLTADDSSCVDQRATIGLTITNSRNLPSISPPPTTSVTQLSVVSTPTSDSEDIPTLFERLRNHSKPSTATNCSDDPLLQSQLSQEPSSPLSVKSLSDKVTRPDETRPHYGIARTPSPLLVDSSDDDDVPLLTRLRKSPLKIREGSSLESPERVQGVLRSTGVSPNVKQLRLDSLFPQRRSVSLASEQKDTGSKSDPIMID